MDSYTESTPLLGRSDSRFPYVATAVRRLREQEIESLSKDDVLALCPIDSGFNPAEVTAFVLVVLLQLRLEVQVPPIPNLWDEWNQERKMQFNVDRLDTEVLTVWSQFAEHWCEDRTLVSTIMMAKFHLDDTHERSVTLLELLCNDPVPKRLLSHRLVDLAINRLWTAGEREPVLYDLPFLLRVMHSLERVSTPRVMHAVDLIMHLVYLISLIHLATYPPLVPSISFPSLGMREIFIIIYSGASLLRLPVTLRIPDLLVFLSFVTSLPSCPLPGSPPYNVVLLAVTLHLIQLHLPYPPSPVFLCFVRYTVPLSTFLWNGFKRAFSPVLLFFIPVFIVSTFVLSLSLADTFLQGFVPTTLVLAPPIETRTAFLAFAFAILILFFISLITSTLNFSSISITRESPWDRFSPRIGYESHRMFVNVVSRYATPRFFPVPFNLLPLVFVHLPSTFLSFLGKNKKLQVLLLVERILWTILVLPISLLTASIWLWGAF